MEWEFSCLDFNPRPPLCRLQLHATYRRKDRVYTENTFYGRGKALTDASAAEVAQDLLERTLENPKAYRNDTLEFALSKDEIKSIEKKEK